MSSTTRRAPGSALTIADQEIPAGSKRTLDVPVARLPTDTWLSLPIAVLNGRWAGPSIWLCAAIHGDELNGVEIIRRIIRELEPRRLRGRVIAVPVVNIFGFINESRYLPDRRDLNRSFPGSKRGSLAARLAQLFMTTVVERCEYGVDFHTGSDHRTNIPHIRGDLDDEGTRQVAEAFGTRFVVHARSRDGSLREAARKRGIRVLVFEGGSAHRFDAEVIEAGVEGTLNVLRHLDMWGRPMAQRHGPRVLARSRWVRATRSGLIRLELEPGQRVEPGQVLGRISDALGLRTTRLTSPRAGWVIGYNQHPLVNRGDAIVHIGEEPVPH